jgi:hypothetical protein
MATQQHYAFVMYSLCQNNQTESALEKCQPINRLIDVF